MCVNMNVSLLVCHHLVTRLDISCVVPIFGGYIFDNFYDVLVTRVDRSFPN